MAADAVELLQREIRFSSGKRIYSLLYGYQYFTDRRFALKMRYTNNHFLTLVEPFDAHSETIVSYRHTKAIRQQPTGSYKVSVRTVTGVDASAICAHLGGGGHKQAAGCELLGSLDNAKAALLTEVEKALCKES